MKNYKIHKIGGAGLMLPYQKLLDLVQYILKEKKPDTQIIIVISALAKITRLLQEIFERKLNGETTKALQMLETIKKIHLQRCADLLVEDINILFEYFSEIEYFILNGSINSQNTSISKAYLLKFGELMSSEVFYQFVYKNNQKVELLDARKMIISYGEDYSDSQISLTNSISKINRVINNISDEKIILTQGYIASNIKGQDKLLGFDGSDLTAAVIALALKVSTINSVINLTYWKDINGVMINESVADKIKYIDYQNLPTTPVRKDSLETTRRYPPDNLNIRSFLNLENPGTKIVWT